MDVGVDHLCLDWYEGVGVWGGVKPNSYIMFCQYFLVQSLVTSRRMSFCPGKSWQHISQPVRCPWIRRTSPERFRLHPSSPMMHNNVLISISSLGTFEFWSNLALTLQCWFYPLQCVGGQWSREEDLVWGRRVSLARSCALPTTSQWRLSGDCEVTSKSMWISDTTTHKGIPDQVQLFSLSKGSSKTETATISFSKYT